MEDEQLAGWEDTATAPLPVLAPLSGLMDSPEWNTTVSAWPPEPPTPVSQHNGHDYSANDDLNSPLEAGVTPPAAEVFAGPGGPFAVRGRRRLSIEGKRVAVIAAAAAAVIALIGMAVTRGGGAEDGAGQQAEAATQEDLTPPDPAQQARLTAMLARDFAAAGACQTVEVPAATGVTARLECTRSANSPASTAGAAAPSAPPPPTATYSLVADPGRLDGLLNTLMADSTVRECPGRIQSPGPWRRAGAQNSSGTVYCGVSTAGGEAVVGWTDTDRLIFVEIRSRPGQSPATADTDLPGLYKWWSLNS